MFVSVDVGRVDAERLELTDLCGGFAFDLHGADAAGVEGEEKAYKRAAELAGAGFEESGDFVCGRCWGAVQEDDMTAYAEGRVRMGDADGVVKSGPAGHQSGGGEGVGLVEFRDGTVNAEGESKVICIKDKARRHTGDVRLSKAWASSSVG